MKFELITTQCVFSNLSKETFLEMLSKAIEISDDYNTWGNINGYNCERRKYWSFTDLEIDFAVHADTDKEIEEFMKEVKR